MTMTALARYRDPSGQPTLGVLRDGTLTALPINSMAELLQRSVADIRALIDAARGRSPEVALADVTVLPPVDGRTEVWGAGVTYQRSRSARAEESRHEKVYLDVYTAPRPELFFKSAAWRVITEGGLAGIRDDATDSIPEPELALLLNQYAEPVGALICNDFTARSIEGENPIYLPQAKIFDASCALSALVVPWWELPMPQALTITLTVSRGHDTVFTGTASTDQMRRSTDELVQWLFRCQSFPDGAVLTTGTGIVPPLGDTLRIGDTVRVTIDGVGTLTNVMAAIPLTVAADRGPHQ